MSSLWTPGGEHPVDRSRPDDADARRAREQEVAEAFAKLSPEEQEQVRAMQSEMAEARARLLEAPAAVVVANHAMGLYELAAIHLTAPQPKLPEASVAIDALGAIVETLGDRLGEATGTLREALTQIRAAYVQVRSATAGASGEPPAEPPAG
jgi:hypothetical protein